MYTVNRDSRIFMTPVSGYDAGSHTFIIYRRRTQQVFEDESALIFYLAARTDTCGYADPLRWSNDIIGRQVYAGKVRSGLTDAYPVEERAPEYYFWFHDAGGRTIDVRAFWPEIIRAVRSGDTDPRRRPVWGRFDRMYSAKHTCAAFAGQRGRVGHLIRQVRKENFYDDDGTLLFQWVPRGKLVDDLQAFWDPDWFAWRGRHSTGWKDHKYRHQWEHGVREKEKHEKNRARKAKAL